MNRNQKTVLLALTIATVFVIILALAFTVWKNTQTVHCDDGSSHPKINAEQFATAYSGYSAKLQAKFNEKSEFGGEIGTQKLQEMSESIQQARLNMQALASGYDACTVTTTEFNSSRDRFQRMEELAREINDIGSHVPLTVSEEARVKQLVQEYIRASQSSNSAKKP